MSKKTYHHSDLKNALFKVCHKLLKNTDPTEISLRLMAEKVGVSHAAIYRHFQDKDELLEMMAIYGFKRLIKAQKNAIKREKTPERKFLKVGVAYIRFAIKNPNYYKNMFFIKRKNPSEELNKVMIRSFSILVSVCKIYLEDKGKLNDPKEFALMSWSLVHGYSDLYLETDYPKSEVVNKKSNPVQMGEDILKNLF
ncbi:MAG: TetR/AcrR family transcriptional regulator [Leptospiraceae bacterium]|nr:TetR/AcrR family transcriptional regulator [Leptospiraceae bacterium]